MTEFIDIEHEKSAQIRVDYVHVELNVPKC
jgi:hypothetical protein